jgi:hypothetical protein
MLSHNSFVYRDYQAVTAPILLLAGWGRWLAYAVLFLGLLDLRNDRSDTPVVGATLPAHPSVSSDKKPIEPGKPEV